MTKLNREIAICDGPNDKGIDGLWVDEDSEEIFLFQAIYTDNLKNTLGDKELRKFVGSAQWFSNAENIKKLLDSQANEELKALAREFQLLNKLEAGYEIKLAFVTTRTLDKNGQEYLDTLPNTGYYLDVWDLPRLVGQHENLERKTRVTGKHRFSTSLPGFDYMTEKGVRAHVRPVRALDIASMNGIADRSLFSLNVRSALGRTRVNREIEKAIQKQDQQHHFVLFHNGVTIICRKLTVRPEELVVDDYSIVNGCQSAVAFFENKRYLTDKLQLIARFIEVGNDDAMAEDITYRSNNQNGINLRDLRSNDRIQVALRRQFERHFGQEVEYLIKAGESSGARESIKNDRAGQWVMALYLNEPYNAHQKYRLFGSDCECSAPR